jgi:hypothetical protein
VKLTGHGQLGTSGHVLGEQRPCRDLRGSAHSEVCWSGGGHRVRGGNAVYQSAQATLNLNILTKPTVPR